MVRGLTPDERKQALDEIAAEVAVCTLCPLHKGRTRAVPGEGHPETEVVFVGEGPGYNEDKEGRPFVGQAGGLLNELLKAIGWRREEVFITNVVKCRPPGNRDPEPTRDRRLRPVPQASAGGAGSGRDRDPGQALAPDVHARRADLGRPRHHEHDQSRDRRTRCHVLRDVPPRGGVAPGKPQGDDADRHGRPARSPDRFTRAPPAGERGAGGGGGGSSGRAHRRAHDRG